MITTVKNTLPGLIPFLLVIFFSSCSTTHYTTAAADQVTLYYQKPGAAKVYFASSIDRYRYHQVTKEDNDLWVITVQADDDFSYFYIVDGSIALPNCPFMINDDFGSYNCLYMYNM